VFIGVDIGGTNTRVAIANEASSGKWIMIFHLFLINLEPFLEVIKFQCNNSKQLIESLRQIGTQLFAVLKIRPVSACLDAAGPIEGGIKVFKD
jgi:glucokinase